MQINNRRSTFVDSVQRTVGDPLESTSNERLWAPLVSDRHPAAVRDKTGSISGTIVRKPLSILSTFSHGRYSPDWRTFGDRYRSVSVNRGRLRMLVQLRRRVILQALQQS